MIRISYQFSSLGWKTKANSRFEYVSCNVVLNLKLLNSSYEILGIEEFKCNHMDPLLFDYYLPKHSRSLRRRKVASLSWYCLDKWGIAIVYPQVFSTRISKANGWQEYITIPVKNTPVFHPE